MADMFDQIKFNALLGGLLYAHYNIWRVNKIGMT